MLDYLLAIGLILLVLVGWILVQLAARRFAAKHPEFGPAKEEGGGCGTGCSCNPGRCRNILRGASGDGSRKQST